MSAAQRPGGGQAKICQFKLVLLGESTIPVAPLLMVLARVMLLEPG